MTKRELEAEIARLRAEIQGLRMDLERKTHEIGYLKGQNEALKKKDRYKDDFRTYPPRFLNTNPKIVSTDRVITNKAYDPYDPSTHLYVPRGIVTNKRREV